MGGITADLIPQAIALIRQRLTPRFMRGPPLNLECGDTLEYTGLVSIETGSCSSWLQPDPSRGPVSARACVGRGRWWDVCG